MAKIGLIETFSDLVDYERDVLKDLYSPEFNRDLKRIRAGMQQVLKTVGDEGEIADILLSERIMALNDREHFANSAAMKTSLDNTLMEIEIAERMLRAINDPEEYRIIAKGFEHPRDSKRGVPVDNARKFFVSHTARLLNQDKARLSDEEKAILSVRRRNIRRAKQIYEAMQRRALESKPKHPEASRNMSMS